MAKSVVKSGLWNPRFVGEGTHFASFFALVSAHFPALDGTQFLLCAVEGPRVGASAQAMAM